MNLKHAAQEGAEREVAFEAWWKRELQSFKYPVMDKDAARYVWMCCIRSIAALTQGKQQAEGAVDRSQPVGAGLTALPAKWDKEGSKFEALGDPISVAEGAVFRNLAKELRDALSVAASPAGERLTAEQVFDEFEQLSKRVQWNSLSAVNAAWHAFKCGVRFAKEGRP